MREKPRRAPKLPEDFTLGRMFTRLRIKHQVRYEDIAEWTAEQGNYISVSSLSDMASGRGLERTSKIKIIARYFQEVLGLSHVTKDYLLDGDDIEKQMIEREYEVLKVIHEIHEAEPLPLEAFAEKAV